MRVAVCMGGAAREAWDRRSDNSFGLRPVWRRGRSPEGNLKRPDPVRPAFCSIPAIGTGTALLLLRGYPLTRERVTEVQSALAQKAAREN